MLFLTKANNAIKKYKQFSLIPSKRVLLLHRIILHYGNANF